MNIASKSVRYELGDFMSTVCFKAAVVGLEDALGEKAAAIALITAGRKRGQQLAQELKLAGVKTQLPLVELTDKVRFALGKEGTRLCVIDRIEMFEERIRVYTRETVCSMNEVEGSSRRCTYTLGAIQGFLEAYLGKRLRGQHIESVLCGSNHDVLEYAPLA